MLYDFVDHHGRTEGNNGLLRVTYLDSATPKRARRSFICALTASRGCCHCSSIVSIPSPASVSLPGHVRSRRLFVHFSSSAGSAFVLCLVFDWTCPCCWIRVLWLDDLRKRKACHSCPEPASACPSPWRQTAWLVLPLPKLLQASDLP
jgi:hypothetical protein